MTILGAFIAVLNIYEFRMFTNYFDKILRQVWPRFVMWDTGMVMIRSGFKRALGPFSHPIVAGYYFSLMAPLAIWCYSDRLYFNKKIGKLVVVLNIIGIMVSISRAPIMGFFLGIIIIFYGWSKNKTAISSIIITTAVIIFLLALPGIIEYSSVTRVTAKTVDQQNVAYRKEMWVAYMEVVFERPWLGWGRFSVPSVKGMKSIDSEYLGIALSSGLIAFSLYIIFLLGMLSKLYLFVRSKSHDDPWGRLSWCLIVGWITAIFTQATVYSGAQTVHYLFMLAGVGQALILSQSEEWLKQKEDVSEIRTISHGFRFKRVL